MPKKHKKFLETPLPQWSEVLLIGTLLIISVSINVLNFINLEKNVNTKGVMTPSYVESQLRASLKEKEFINNRVWIKLPDPPFEIISITDRSCSSCADLSLTLSYLAKRFPTATLRNVDISSKTGKKLVEKGIQEVPVILFSEPFQYVEGAKEMMKTDGITALSQTFFQMKGNGNKKLLDSENLPTTYEINKKVSVVIYDRFLSGDTKNSSLIASTLNESVNKNLIYVEKRPIIQNPIDSLLAEAMECGVEPSKIVNIRTQLQQQIRAFVENPEKLTESEIKKSSNLLKKLLSMDKTQSECYTNHTFQNKVQRTAAEAVRIGLTTFPSYVIGHELLIGDQNIEDILDAIKEQQ